MSPQSFTGLFLMILPVALYAQEPDTLQFREDRSLVDQMEYKTEQADAELDFSQWIDELEVLTNRPVNLNSDNENELRRLTVLNEQQIQNLLAYTREYGQLASMYELQLIDGFNQEFIEQLLPYISLTNYQVERFNLKRALKYSRPVILLRYQRVAEHQQGFSKVTDSLRQQHPNDYYLGSPDALYFRVVCNYRDRFQYGLVAEKDAGETFFPATDSLRKGFDFYSAHLYLKDIGKLKQLAIGDYHLQFGQGLTLCTGLSFGKTPGGLPMRKRATPVRPHTSANESAFLRGVAATIGLGYFEFTGFYSNRMRDANLLENDSLSLEDQFVSSLQETGYHRTPGELADRNAIREQLMGGHLRYDGNRFRAGITAYHSGFDKEFQIRETEYTKFQPRPTSNSCIGVDYSYSYKRLTVYGEVAMQLKNGFAQLYGLSFTPDPRLSLAMIYRNYPANYLNNYSSAFGEGGSNTNETGFYMGLSTTPVKNISITAYADYFRYPWLHFRVDAPSRGNEYSLHLSYPIGRKGNMAFRYRQAHTPQNLLKESTNNNSISITTRNYFQWQFTYQALTWLSVSNRVYFLNRTTCREPSSKGYFISQDLKIQPVESAWTISFRYALFDTDSYETRMYAYENDVPYSFSVPSLSGRGSRFYLMGKIRLLDRFDCWVRYARTFYSDVVRISEGPAMIEGNTKSDMKVMVRIKL